MANIYKVRPLVSFARSTMVGIDVLVFLSTFLGGYILIVLNGAGMDVARLNGSPFTSYFWPGVILVGVVGMTHLLAAILLIRGHMLWAEASAVAGLGLLIWIMTEIFIIRDLHLLQLVYFYLGVLNITLTIFTLRTKMM